MKNILQDNPLIPPYACDFVSAKIQMFDDVKRQKQKHGWSYFLIFLACGLMILLKIITSIAVDFLDFWAMNTDSAMNYFMMASEHGHFRGTKFSFCVV